MAANPKIFIHFIIAIFLSYYPYFCFCTGISSFQDAVATWYDDPSIYGSGERCGFENDVTKPPFSGKIAAGNQALFKDGRGCNICYEVKCTENPDCSGVPVTITITDECPGCDMNPMHFSLSYIAFGLLAKPGRGENLSHVERLNVQYQRVACYYPGTSIMFKVDKEFKQYLAVAIEYQNGEGDLSIVELNPGGSTEWLQMHQHFGATYKYNIPTHMNGPYSIRLATMKNRTLVAKNVIPADWKPGAYYESNVNFSPALV